MLIICGAVVGILFGLLDFFILKNKKNFGVFVFCIIKESAIVNLITLAVMKYFLHLPNVFYASRHTTGYLFKYIIFASAFGFLFFIIKCILSGKITFERRKETTKAGGIVLKIISILFFTLGAAAFTATIWGKATFGDITPDQFLVNLKSPIVGTSSDVMNTAFEGPVFETLVSLVVFLIVLFFPYGIILNGKNNSKPLFSGNFKNVTCLLLSILILAGGITFGAVKFQFKEIYHAYVSESKYIEENYVNPNEVKITIPEKKRNLIHIYLESIENSFLSKDLGGNCEQNLMPELTDLAQEGIVFSDNSGKFGGPIQTTGSGWSVASMSNMEFGVPLKIPMDGNSYGKSGHFLPGAVGIGDILHKQGYNQTIMFGADSDFGGLTAFFTEHGQYKIMDYKYIKESGKIPPDYYVWWGYEDDKLYEYAKEELLRLGAENKPFHFEMETADTHFPDGYLSPNVENKYESQYANVISYSTAETVKFIRWIQQQDFYENTTIVLTGDHRSMDKKFFENFDKEYNRTIFNLFLNSAAAPQNVTNRQYAPFDFYPTILASIGITSENSRLALGTNLFSNEPTIIERDSIEVLEKELNERSNFYNDELIAESKSSEFKIKESYN